MIIVVSSPLIIFPQKLLNSHLLSLLIDEPFAIFLQEPLEVFCFLFAVNGGTHPFSYVWRAVIPNDCLLHLIRNLIAKYVV